MLATIDIDPAVYNRVYDEYLDCMSRVQIFYGGASSGKSVFVAQRAVEDVLRGGRNYLIARAVGRDNRRSTFLEIGNVIREWSVTPLFTANKTELVYTCENGYQIIFAGLDDTEKIKSIRAARGAITDVWIEEATQVQADDIKQLLRRQRGGSSSVPKRLTLTFNPIYKLHHIYQTYFAPIGWADKQVRHDSPELTIRKTTYLDNEFLTPDDVLTLESEPPGYWRDVYTLGNWGVLGDVIFTNWEVADLSEMRDQFTNRRNGLDFGFASDPAAMVRTHYDRPRQTIYIFDELYERGLTNDVLADEIAPRLDGDVVVCDSAEPKSIFDLQQHGVSATGAKKGKDSVNHGINWLQRQRIIIDRSCVNTISEFQTYQWKKDRDGNAIRQPVDKRNHAIDGLRYAYEDDMAGGGLFL